MSAAASHRDTTSVVNAPLPDSRLPRSHHPFGACGACDLCTWPCTKAEIALTLPSTRARSVLLDCASPPCAKLGDFGISILAGAAYDGEQVMDGAFQSLGTPRYQAPEVTSAVSRAGPGVKSLTHELLEILDTRSDVYSYGCLLYELLHGRVVMEESHAFGAMIKVWKGQRSELSLRPEHAHLATMIERCWDEDPDRRMQLEDIVRGMADYYDDRTAVSPALAEGLHPTLCLDTVSNGRKV